MQLVLSRSSAQQQALERLLADQQNPASPRYRQWLTPNSFGATFGPSQASLDALTSWLTSQGFTHIHVNAGRTLVEFSGTAANVHSAFATTLHRVSVGGQTGYAALQAPTIPARFAPLVVGFASLNSILHGPSVSAAASAPLLRRDSKTHSFTPIADVAHPETTIPSNGTTYYGISPSDFATLYNVTPLWNAATPITGSGETIAVAGDTDINPADFVSFRNVFSLPIGSTATATGTQYLNIIYNGAQPAVLSDEYHADSDTQWASAAAKNAVIDYVASQSTEASSGLDLSAEYIVDNNLAPILVDSYYTCELELGTAGNVFYQNLWQQAAAQGITVVTATGDSGAAECDAFHVAPASNGLAVNGIASTPYDVAVGGTEFNVSTSPANYFNSSNSSTQASITGYIPELVWNDSCTDPTVLEQSQFAGDTAEQACNSSAAQSAGYVVTAGSGGGASACTASDGQNPASCSTGYPKPSWQSAPGVPADGVRDIPDVSLFASQGRTNTFYLVCQQDRDPNGAPCNVNYPYADFAAYGGTEVAAPAFAGILALAAQQAGTRIGNPNPVLYNLASSPAQTQNSCSATGNPAAGCIFNDITAGTNAMPCVAGSLNCNAAAGDSVGILSAASATAGYDLASGLGSVNAYNLVESFTNVQLSPATAILSLTPSSIVHGQPVTTTVNVMGQGGTPTGEISINAQAANGFVGFGPLSSGTYTQTFRNFPGGIYGVQAYYAGDSTYAPVDSNFVSLTVTPEPSTTTIQTLGYNPVTGTAAPVSNAPYGDIWYIRATVAGVSGQGTATGNVAMADSGTALGAGVSRLNSSGYTEVQENAFTPGTHVFTGTYSGDPSFNPSTAAPATLTITKGPTTVTVSSNVTTVPQGSVVTLSAVVGTQSFGYAAPTGDITFYSGSTVIGKSSVFAGVNATTIQQQGIVSLTLSAKGLPLGADSITASYAGDSNYLPSSSSAIPVQVTPNTLPASSTLVFPTPYAVLYGGGILYTAIITPASPSPTGTLQFAVDGNNVGTPQTVVTGGFAALNTTVAGLSPGLHNLTGTYSGDAQYASSMSVSAAFLVTTTGTASHVSFTADPTNVVQGTYVSVPTTVSPAAPSAGAATPTGTVQLVLDGSLYGSKFPLTDAAFTLSLPTLTLQVGTHVLSVFYSGDGIYSSSYGDPITLKITAPGVTPSVVSIANLPPTVGLGSTASFTANVAPLNPVAGSPTPTGVVEVTYDNGIPSAPILLSGGSAQLTLPGNLPLGPHTVSVFYSGDNTYDFSTSAVQTFTVVVPDFTMTPASINSTVSNLGPGPSTYLFTLTPNTSLSFAVSFSCSGLPKNSTCAFSPAAITFDGSKPLTTTLTLILDTGVPGVYKAGVTRPISRTNVMELAGLLCLGLPLAFARRRSRLVRLAAMLFLVGLVTTLNGCGHGYTDLAGITPPGTYTVTVNAISPYETHTSTITLTVQK